MRNIRYWLHWLRKEPNMTLWILYHNLPWTKRPYYCNDCRIELNPSHPILCIGCEWHKHEFYTKGDYECK